jgi:hypothetical protein
MCLMSVIWAIPSRMPLVEGNLHSHAKLVKEPVGTIWKIASGESVDGVDDLSKPRLRSLRLVERLL